MALAVHKGVDQEEWYFLSPRTSMYGNGVRPKRKTEDGRGRWKASTASKEVDQKVVCNGITFCRSVLNYFEGVPRKEVRTKWIMLELKVPCFEIKLDKAAGLTKDKLDELVVCKIYVSPQHKKRGDPDEEGTISACEVDDGTEEEAFSPTQHDQGTTAGLDKQAGKRPMLGKVTTRTDAYYGVPGQPTGGAHSSLQASQIPQRPTQQTPAVYPFGQTTTATTTVQPPALENLGFPGNPPRQIAGRASRPPRRDPETAFRPQVSLQCYYDQNYRGVNPPPAANASSSSSQPQMLAASFLPPQPQLSFLDGDAAPGGTPYDSHPYQSRALSLEVAGHDGATNGRSGTPRCLNVNDEQFFVDLAMTTSTPSLIGARTQAPAPACLVVESQPPVAAGAVKVETETGEASALNKEDAV